MHAFVPQGSAGSQYSAVSWYQAWLKPKTGRHVMTFISGSWGESRHHGADRAIVLAVPKRQFYTGALLLCPRVFWRRRQGILSTMLLSPQCSQSQSIRLSKQRISKPWSRNSPFRPSGSKEFGGLLAQKSGAGEALWGPVCTKGAARITFPLPGGHTAYDSKQAWTPGKPSHCWQW